MFENVDSRPLAGLLQRDGNVTEGQRPGRTMRRRNAVVACALPVAGKRVLDLGCAEGITALYMAETAAQVVGLDHRQSVIDSARKNAEAVGLTNVEFVCLDVREADALQALGAFDLVTAWGLLHRVADTFALFETLSVLAPRVSLEWRAPILPGLGRIPLAHHPNTSVLDPSNLRLSGSAQKVEALSGFWEPSVGAVRSIGAAFGYGRCEVLGYGERLTAFSSQMARSVGHQVRDVFRERRVPRFPMARVHVGMTRDHDDSFFQRLDLSNAVVPPWDTRMAATAASG